MTADPGGFVKWVQLRSCTMVVKSPSFFSSLNPRSGMRFREPNELVYRFQASSLMNLVLSQAVGGATDEDPPMLRRCLFCAISEIWCNLYEHKQKNWSTHSPKLNADSPQCKPSESKPEQPQNSQIYLLRQFIEHLECSPQNKFWQPLFVIALTRFPSVEITPITQQAKSQRNTNPQIVSINFSERLKDNPNYLNGEGYSRMNL